MLPSIHKRFNELLCPAIGKGRGDGWGEKGEMTAQTEPLCTHFSAALPLPRIMGVWPVGDGEFEKRLFSSFICTPSYFPPSRTMSTLLSYLLRWNLNGRVCFVLRKIQILRGNFYRLSDLYIHWNLLPEFQIQT